MSAWPVEPSVGIPVVIAAAVLEFFETFGTWRWSRRGRGKAGPETLIGGSGRAITDCAILLFWDCETIRR